MRYCENCGHEISGNDIYCENCGKHVGVKFCTECGSALNESANFCPNCGKKQEVAPSVGIVCKKRKYKKHVIPLIVWSLILVALVNPVGTPLSAASALYLLSANSDEDEESSDLKIKKSLILCIAATVLDIITIIVLVSVAISKYNNRTIL